MYNLKTQVNQFCNNVSGQIAIMFALLMVPMAVFIGAGIDWSQQINANTKLQSTLDSAALAVARRLSVDKNLTMDQMKAVAQKIITANTKVSSFVTLDEFSLVFANDLITITQKGSVKTSFLKLVNVNSLNLIVSTEVNMKFGGVDLALSVDLSGSMQGTKISELKKATIILLDELSNAAVSEMRVSFIPWTRAVNLGKYFEAVTGEAGEGEEDLSELEQEKLILTVQIMILENSINTLEAKIKDLKEEEHDATKEDKELIKEEKKDAEKELKKLKDEKKKLEKDLKKLEDKKDKKGKKDKKDKDKDKDETNHCVDPRDSGKMAINDIPYKHAPDASGWFCSESYLIPLTDLLEKVDGETGKEMLKDIVGTWKAEGGTGSHSGMYWAWATLHEAFYPIFGTSTPDDPASIKKYAIIMTDGTNSKSEFNVKMLASCKAMKAEGIFIYTIVLMENDASVTNTFKECASPSTDGREYFIKTNTAAALTTSFKQIAGEIGSFYLSK